MCDHFVASWRYELNLNHKLQQLFALRYARVPSQYGTQTSFLKIKKKRKTFLIEMKELLPLILLAKRYAGAKAQVFNQNFKDNIRL